MLFPDQSVMDVRSQLVRDLEKEKITPERAFKKFLELSAYDYPALLGMADLRRDAGDVSAAEAFAWRAAEAQPCVWIAWMELARLADQRGESGLSQGFGELALRKLLLDPVALEDVPFEPIASLPLEGLEDLDGKERLQALVVMLQSRRDLEPPEVTARLRPYRLLQQLQEAEDLDPDLVDAIVREGSGLVPPLVGILRVFAETSLLDEDEWIVENTLALLGEIGSPLALEPLLEFCVLENDDLSGAASWAVDRIVELHPDEAAQALYALAPGFDGTLRLAVAERLIVWPRWNAVDRLFDRLTENADRIPREERGEFFFGLITSMIAARRREGVELARRMLRRNASLMDRNARRTCDEQIELFSEAGGQLLQGLDEAAPKRAEWTVYQICAGEAEWPSDEDEEDEFGDGEGFDGDETEEDSEPAQLPVRRHAAPGRNDPCWCGSGRKYKKCHLDADQQPGNLISPGN
jgi:hypothetical protein